ncbi:MAG: phosphate ABC transporter permease PstA [Chlorobiota bacterium]|jgi:phosphate transport system permease protein|nr:MAG: phosphate ABC transporter permease PstA [Chlorobiota bacterium]
MIERRLQPSPWVEYRRRIVNALGHGVVALATVVVLFPLIAVIWYTLREGIPGLTWDFFTQLPKPVGEVGGGMANAIVGSGIVVGLASLVAIPLGILAGIFISEYASARLAAAIRFVTEVMLGLPSILLGIFAYAVVVKPIGHFSAYAGAAALAIVMLPIVIKTTEEILRLVPRHIREAGLALGIPQWVVVLRIILRAASRGIVTGILLAVARAAGETAPLLFTALNNRFWHTTLDQPIATLPVQIFTYAVAPYEDWHRQAWAGALVLIGLVLVLSIVLRLVVSRTHFEHEQ